MDELRLVQVFRNNAGNSSPIVQHTIGQNTHQSGLPGTIDQGDLRFCQQLSQLVGSLIIYRMNIV